MPPYLRNIVGAYLSNRSIKYIGRDGLTHMRTVNCGVPQGSVLGPILWNLAYDAVLDVSLPYGVHIVCYADDTVVMAEENTFDNTLRLAEIGVASVVTKIHELGLRVAPHKTEAIWFHKLPRRLEPPSSSIRVDEFDVQVGKYLKYLGLILDSRWGFEEHFERLVPRIQNFAGAMHALLPNIRGPQEGVRRVYAEVVRSMALYGAPVWSERLSSVKRLRAKLNSVQRKMAIRVVRGYRTISFEAATVLARFPPLDILAAMDARVYAETRTICASDREGLQPEGLRKRAHRQALIEWRLRLEEERNARQRAVGAILPNLEAWLARKRGNITFRLTQVLTGHGCFGEYLFRIGREVTPRCHHCGGDQDTAQHTLEDCPAWESERRVLINNVGGDLSPPAVIAAMLAKDRAWKAAASFCETVMLKKEAAERDLERANPARRRKRRGHDSN
ncbi:jg8953 [Pararge aegeria aegeria]|uniref:Jg8953 protein n=1 Tax=Pararge aegeria aegeria TaxID=348720 RepID=A0A8S4SCB5_9NEOP|nr:jg8953 [Pararge aegeria aegeria]